MHIAKEDSDGIRWAFTKFKTEIQWKYHVTRSDTKYCNFHAYLEIDEFVKWPIDSTYSVKKTKLESYLLNAIRVKISEIGAVWMV